MLQILYLVRCALRLRGGNGIGLGREESTTLKPSRLQRVWPMGMSADDPPGKPKSHTLPCSSYNFEVRNGAKINIEFLHRVPLTWQTGA